MTKKGAKSRKTIEQNMEQFKHNKLKSHKNHKKISEVERIDVIDRKNGTGKLDKPSKH